MLNLGVLEDVLTRTSGDGVVASTIGPTLPTGAATPPVAPDPAPPMPWYHWILGTLNAGSVWMTELAAANFRRELPQFSTFAEAAARPPSPEDAEAANLNWFLTNPALLAHPELRAAGIMTLQTLPTIEEAEAAIPGFAAGAAQAAELVRPGLGPAVEPAFGMVGAVGAPFLTEEFVAQTLHDPLFVAEGFNVGRRAINGIRLGWSRGVAPQVAAARRASPAVDNIVSPVVDAADAVIGHSVRQVYRVARPFIGERAYGEFEYAQRLTRQRRAVAQLLPEGAEALEEVGGRITRAIEEVPAYVREPFEELGELQARRLEPRIPAEAPAWEMIQDEVWDYVERTFGDLPDATHRHIVDLLQESWLQGARLPEIERLMGIPTRNLLSDIAYVDRVFTRDARRARIQSIPDWRVRMMEPTQNVLGEELTQTLHRRSLRAAVGQYNEMAEAGRVGFINGRLRILAEGAEEIPEGFVAVNKLLNDDPWFLAHSRFTRSTRALSGAHFLREIAENPGFVGDGPTLEGFARASRRMTMGEFERTFGALGGDLEEIARKVTWRDERTAEGVIGWMRVMQDLQDRPGLVGRIYDRGLGYWRGLTLTPFLGYHMRNAIGGLNNHFLSGGNLFDFYDAMWLHRIEPEYLDEFMGAGLNRMGQIRHSWAATFDEIYTTPLDQTVARSWFRSAFDPTYRHFWGRTIAEAIETQQRLATFLGARRRGLIFDDAADTMFKYHFDYGDIPPWLMHGTAARRMVSFPIWTLKNIPVQLEHLITTPTHFSWRGRYIAGAREMAGLPGAIQPEFITEGGGFPVPTGDPENPMFFRPENFDPAATISEITDPKRFVWELLNPFITEPLEQVGAAALFAEEEMPERPFVRGYDPFRQREIVTPWRDWNPALDEARMPYWAQRADHVARSFFRMYSETSGLIREGQRMAAGESAYAPAEYGVRRLGGVPLFRSQANQTLYFNLRRNQREIGSLHRSMREREIHQEEIPEADLSDLKELYTQRLAQLAFGTFMEADPWTGEPRPWHDIPQDGEATIRGRQELWRDFLRTGYLMMYGRTGPGNEQLHEPLALDETEVDFIEELIISGVAGYETIMALMSLADGADVNRRAERGYARTFLEEPEEEED